MRLRSYWWAPSFMGVAASYVRESMAGEATSPTVLAVWFAMGVLASVGAARMAQLLTTNRLDAPPSAALCTLAYIVGSAVWAFRPGPWLRAADYAGFVLMVAFTLGWLVGVGDLTMRLTNRRIPHDR